MIARACLLTGLLAASPAGAATAGDVRDVLIVERDTPHVWIALDPSPSHLAARSEPGRLTLDLADYPQAGERTIMPVNDGPLTAITVTARADGARIRLEGDFAGAASELRQGGIWIALDGSLDGSLDSSVDGSVSRPSGDGPADAIPATPAPAAAPAAEDPGDPPAAGDAAATGREADGPAEVEAARTAAGLRAAGDGGAAQSLGASRDDAAGSPPDELGASGDRAVSRAPSQSGELERGRTAEPQTGAPEAQIAADPDAPGPCDATAAAVQQSPWDLDGLTRHADCLAGINERANAAGLYERVLAFDPSHFRAAIGLARIREAQGRPGDAAELYERAANAALTDGQAMAARAGAGRVAAADDGAEP